jgi:hypothetical protein
VKRTKDFKAVIAEALQKKTWGEQEAMVGLYPALAIPVMLHHLDRDQPFEAIAVLRKVGEKVGADESLPMHVLGAVLYRAVEQAKTHLGWRAQLQNAFFRMPTGAIQLVRERLPGTEHEDALAFLPKRH